MQSNGIDERYATFDELRRRLAASWLSAHECREMQAWRHPRRREAWLMGRLLSKQLILDSLDEARLDPRRVEIFSRDAEGRSVRPRIFLFGKRQPWCLSISHAERSVLAALSTSAHVKVGVDLTSVEDCKPGFLAVWFTQGEQSRLQPAERQRVATYWAIKEAVYKATNSGERFSPRSLEVLEKEAGKYGCFANGVDLTSVCTIRRRMIDGQVAVVATVALRERHNKFPERQTDKPIRFVSQHAEPIVIGTTDKRRR